MDKSHGCPLHTWIATADRLSHLICPHETLYKTIPGLAFYVIFLCMFGAFGVLFYGVMNRSYTFTPELISLAERDTLYPDEGGGGGGVYSKYNQ